MARATTGRYWVDGCPIAEVQWVEGIGLAHTVGKSNKKSGGWTNFSYIRKGPWLLGCVGPTVVGCVAD
jgi:hypothetical protein